MNYKQAFLKRIIGGFVMYHGRLHDVIKGDPDNHTFTLRAVMSGYLIIGVKPEEMEEE